jgi:hypothetical protein
MAQDMANRVEVIGRRYSWDGGHHGLRGSPPPKKKDDFFQDRESGV